MKQRKKKLTAKQKEAVYDLADDMKVPEIATKRKTFYRKIEKRIERAKDVYGVKTVQGLVAAAHRKGDIDLNKP